MHKFIHISSIESLYLINISIKLSFVFVLIFIVVENAEGIVSVKVSSHRCLSWKQSDIDIQEDFESSFIYS